MTHIAPLLGEIRDSRIFMTGGTGFFGGWLLESLLRANDELGLNATVCVLTRNLAAFRKKSPYLAGQGGIEFVEGDVLSFEFPSGEFPFVIHAATETARDLYDHDPLLAFETILSGTRRVLEFTRRAGGRKFLFTSSGAVYGKQPPQVSHLREDHMLSTTLSEPHVAYAEGKRAAELLCSMYAAKYGFEVKIVRAFAFVGPNMPLDAHFAIGNFIRDALKGGPVEVNGDGTPYRSYLYAADLVIWLWTILLRGKSCTPYNVGSDAALQIREVAALVAEAAGGMEVVVKGVADPARPAERYVPGVDLARANLGLGVEIPLAEAIRRTMLFYRKHNSCHTEVP